MSTLSATHPTLLDFKAALDPNDKVATVIEMLAQTNEVLQDAVVMEGNLLTGHVSTVRTGLPTATWRKMYGGVQPSKSTRAKVTDTIGMLEAYAEIDKAEADLNGNSAAWRLSEDSAFIESMSQEVAQTLWYGNEGTEPEAFTGLTPRYNDRSALNGENILTSATPPDGSDNTSIWLVVWGPQTCFLTYPKGSKAGLQIEDKGQVTIESLNGDGGRMEAYRTHYRWDVGLVVRDWRYIVRVCYDLENVVANGATGPVLEQLMAKALRRVPSLGMGRPAFYMNRDSLDAFDLQANNKTTMAFKSIEDAQGKVVNYFRGVPVRRSDQLLSTESLA